jgi:HSP20 family molecular chaperone IbpA
MPIKKTVLEQFWKVADHVLLVAIFALTLVWFVSSRRADASLKTETVRQEEPVARVPRSMPSAGKTVDGMRVSLEGDRVNNIARSMAESAWEQVPESPAVDMRENGKSFEIFFAMPPGLNASDVRVSARDGILTVAMISERNGAAMLQRFQIPRSVERREDIETSVSNSVLCICIRPGG